jgi:hypothetical protein
MSDRPRKPYHTRAVQRGLERLAMTSNAWDDDIVAARNWIDAMSGWRLPSETALPAGRGGFVSLSAAGATSPVAPAEEAER